MILGYFYCSRDRVFWQVGRLEGEKPAAIRLSGDNILEEHCYFDNSDGKVFIYCMPDSATVCDFLLMLIALIF